MADLFDIVVARKLSGGGGGGSSDFSTAQVTFTSTANSYLILIASITEGQGIGLFPVDVQAGTPLTLTIPLYQNAYGMTLDCFMGIDSGAMPSCTGGVSLEEYGILITGDGTFTAAGLAE